MLEFRLMFSAVFATVVLIMIGLRLAGTNEAAAGLVLRDPPRLEMSIMEKPLPKQQMIPVPVWVAPPPTPWVVFAAIDTEQDTIMESAPEAAGEMAQSRELVSIEGTESALAEIEETVAAETPKADFANQETATAAVANPEAEATSETVMPAAVANADVAEPEAAVKPEALAPEIVVALAEAGLAVEVGSAPMNDTTSDETAPDLTGSIGAMAALSEPPPVPVARPDEIPPKRVVRARRRVRQAQPAQADPAAEKDPFKRLAKAIEEHRRRLEAAAAAARAAQAARSN